MQIKKIAHMNDGILIETSQGELYLAAISQSIIRCAYNKKKVKTKASELIESGGEKVALSYNETPLQLEVFTDKLLLQIDKKDAKFCWFDKQDNRLLLEEAGKELTEIDVVVHGTGGEAPIVERVKTVDGERNYIKNLRAIVDRKAYRGKLSFNWQEDEAIYGLGQGEEGIYNYRGHNQYLYQHNMRIPIPFFVSNKNYGILMDCAGLMTFQDDHNGSYLFMDTIEQLDYYFIAGEQIDDLIDGYRRLTGKAVMLPKWSFGYVQSKEAYHNQEEMVKVGERYRELEIPIDCLVQDWNTWLDGKWGQKTVDKSRYPNLTKMNDKLHDLHIHTMVSMWPNMNPGGENHQEFADANLLLADYSTYNAFSEEGRKMYWKQANEELFKGGFDSWWCDSTEPFPSPDWGGEVKKEPWERYYLVGEEHKKYLDPAQANTFSLLHAKGIFENQRQEKPDMRVLNLTRSGYVGSQKYGTVLWSGDTFATWDSMKIQIKEGLNFALSGMPYWTLDIGAFFVVGEKWQNRGCNCSDNPTPLWFWQGAYDDGVDDWGYRELYVRWLQYGAFLPMFRSHGTDTPREIWNFGKPGEMFYDAIAKTIKLRYQLMPYIYSLAGHVWKYNATMHRSLLFDFANDTTACGIWDEFMLGKELLIAPVTKPMYYDVKSTPLQAEKSRECYLPKGYQWYDFWTEEVYDGGQWITSETPIDKIPIYVRAGSIIPMAKDLQYAEEQNDRPMEIKIYPGTNGEFVLYEDDNQTYQYEQGEYTTIKLSWDEDNKICTIGEREGSFGQMAKERRFCICVGNQSSLIDYDGKEVKISF